MEQKTAFKESSEKNFAFNTDVVNFANFVTSELRAASPYRTGNMQRSIVLVSVNGSDIQIIISVDYASYVNKQSKHYHWIQKVLDRCARAYSQNNVDVTNSVGIDYKVIEGE